MDVWTFVISLVLAVPASWAVLYLINKIVEH